MRTTYLLKSYQRCLRHYLISFHWIIILCMLSAVSCQEEDIKWSNDIVIEGRIEKDSCARVVITRQFTFSGEEELNLSNFNVDDAEVWVSDGINSEQLMCVVDSSSNSFKAYKGRTIRGCEGMSYSLTINHENRTYYATTTIMPLRSKVTLSTQPHPNNAKKMLIQAHFDIPPRTCEYVQAYVRNASENEKIFFASYMGNIELIAEEEPQEDVLVLLTNPTNYFKKYEPLFDVGTKVEIKISAVTREVYDFWDSFTTHISTVRLPLLQGIDNLKSNISGAVGYWEGISSVVMVPSVQE